MELIDSLLDLLQQDSNPTQPTVPSPNFLAKPEPTNEASRAQSLLSEMGFIDAPGRSSDEDFITNMKYQMDEIFGNGFLQSVEEANLDPVQLFPLVVAAQFYLALAENECFRALCCGVPTGGNWTAFVRNSVDDHCPYAITTAYFDDALPSDAMDQLELIVLESNVADEYKIGEDTILLRRKVTETGEKLSVWEGACGETTVKLGKYGIELSLGENEKLLLYHHLERLGVYWSATQYEAGEQNLRCEIFVHSSTVEVETQFLLFWLVKLIGMPLLSFAFFAFVLMYHERGCHGGLRLGRKMTDPNCTFAFRRESGLVGELKVYNGEIMLTKASEIVAIPHPQPPKKVVLAMMGEKRTKDLGLLVDATATVEKQRRRRDSSEAVPIVAYPVTERYMRRVFDSTDVNEGAFKINYESEDVGEVEFIPRQRYESMSRAKNGVSIAAGSYEEMQMWKEAPDDEYLALGESR